MRLAIFWHDLLHYHTARIHALIDYAQQRGHTVQAFILCAAPADLSSDDEHNTFGAQVTILAHDPATAGEFSHQSKQQLLAGLDAFQPDAVAIIGYTGPVARAAVGWCRYHRRGAILMLSSHAADYARVWWKEWPKRQLVSLYDAAFVSGKPQAAYAQQLGLPAARIGTGYGVVANDFWQQGAASARQNASQLRAHYGLPARFFLTACRFVAKKNLAGLLKAYAQYRDDLAGQPDAEPWSLVIVGDGELAPALRQQVAAAALTAHVHFPGYLPAPQMATYYGLASAFVLASSYAEQWGLVVNEAMTAGLPVLVSEICGCVPDLVIAGQTGFTFDPTCTAEIAQLLARVSSGQVNLARMGCQAQAQIQHYSPQTFAAQLFVTAEIAIEHAQTRRRQVWPSPSHWR